MCGALPLLVSICITRLLHHDAYVDAFDSIGHFLVYGIHVYRVVDIYLTRCREDRKREVREEVFERCCRHIHVELTTVYILECVNHYIAVRSVA